MSILSFFRTDKKNKKSAVNAKDRLQVIVAVQRKERESINFLPKLKEEIMDVIKKYFDDIPEESIKLQLDKQDDNCTVLELNVSLPEKSKV
ncbi:MAG: cell division topological specificity factor MinE [Gammaproteobacteria bacterium]|nr:cell division topological specificity factor MinE [Gammaproteobacteria bacterium]